MNKKKIKEDSATIVFFRTCWLHFIFFSFLWRLDLRHIMCTIKLPDCAYDRTC